MDPSRNDGPFRPILSETHRKTGRFWRRGQSFGHNRLELLREYDSAGDVVAALKGFARRFHLPVTAVRFP
jgi:hypothetical protein